MAKYSTPLVVIFAVVLTVATGATLIELNRRGRAEFDELATRLSDLDAKYQALYRDLRGEMFARNAALRKELTERIAQSAE
jgi:outer membrane murein-binding lipoprotein Lpp